MRRLGFFALVSLLLLGPGCSKENPAFDDCETDASCADETVASGDGDGDPSGDGDGDTGDGDGDASGDGEAWAGLTGGVGTVVPTGVGEPKGSSGPAGVRVAVGATVAVRVGMGVAEGVPGTGVPGTAVTVGVGVEVSGVGVSVPGVEVSVGVAVGVGLSVGVSVGVGVEVSPTTHFTTDVRPTWSVAVTVSTSPSAGFGVSGPQVNAPDAEDVVVHNSCPPALATTTGRFAAVVPATFAPLAAVTFVSEAGGRAVIWAADAVNVTSDRWHLLRLQMPQGRGLPRFRRLELRVTPSGEDSPILMVGKVEPR